MTVERKDLIQSFLFGNTIVRNGWYLQMIIVIYYVYYCCFKYIDSIERKILGVTCGCILYCIICAMGGLSSIWYECTMCLPLGLIMGNYQEKIDVWCEKHYFVLLSLVLLVFIFTFLGELVISIPYVKIPLKMLSSIFFVSTVILLIQRIPIKNRITGFLGGIYMEIYVLHGTILILLEQYSEYFTPFQHFALAIVGSLLIAWIMKRPLALAMGLVKRSTVRPI